MPSPRQLTTAFALGRLAFGAGLMARPERVASGWVGKDAERGAVKIVLRGLGARDVALSAGALAARGDEDRLAHWIAAAIGCDLSDVVSTLAAPPDSLPGNARWGTVALGGGAALAGALLLAEIKR
ncbi:MAG: hypothetical protein H0U25_03195 [Thermoleophilaceae bacterium]|nr:hypothetical protein [Thermoleophilaceae bacterium]